MYVISFYFPALEKCPANKAFKFRQLLVMPKRIKGAELIQGRSCSKTLAQFTTSLCTVQ